MERYKVRHEALKLLKSFGVPKHTFETYNCITEVNKDDLLQINKLNNHSWPLDTSEIENMISFWNTLQTHSDILELCIPQKRTTDALHNTIKRHVPSIDFQFEEYGYDWSNYDFKWDNFEDVSKSATVSIENIAHIFGPSELKNTYGTCHKGSNFENLYCDPLSCHMPNFKKSTICKQIRA